MHLLSENPSLSFEIINANARLLRVFNGGALGDANITKIHAKRWFSEGGVSPTRRPEAEKFLRTIARHIELESLHLVANTATQDTDMGAHLRQGLAYRLYQMRASIKMPAVRDLVLENYDWRHDRQDTKSLWNWTRIVRLELRNVPLLSFLRTVVIEEFVNLQDFTTDECKLLDMDQYDEAISGLCRLISTAKTFRRLRTQNLNITENPPCIAALQKHSETLFELSLRDQDHFIDNVVSNLYRHYRSDIEVLVDNFPKITDLTTDVSFGPELDQDVERIKMLCEYRNLRRLTLYARQCYTEDVIPAPTQAMMAAAKKVKSCLLSHKQGAAFESIELVEIGPQF